MVTVIAILGSIAAFFWWVMSLGAAREAAKSATAIAAKKEADAHAVSEYADTRGKVDDRAEVERARVAPPDPLDVAAAARARDELERLLNGGRLPGADPEAGPTGKA